MQNVIVTCCRCYPPTFGNPGVPLDEGDDDGVGDDECVGFGDGFAVFDRDGDGFVVADVDVELDCAATSVGFGDAIAGVTTAVAWLASALMSELVALSTASAPGGRLFSSNARSAWSSCAIASACAGSPSLFWIIATIC